MPYPYPYAMADDVPSKGVPSYQPGPVQYGGSTVGLQWAYSGPSEIDPLGFDVPPPIPISTDSFSGYGQL